MTALIDGDSILYKYASINQEQFDWGDGIIITDIDEKSAKAGLVNYVTNILSHTKTDDFEFILSPKRTFRYDVLETYKSNRKEPKVPLELLPVLREYATTELNAFTPSYIEADDYVVAKLTTDPSKYIACHIDKDLNQGAGRHYNYYTQEHYTVSEEEADFFFYQQVLEGDYVDGIKGCNKIGRKKAIRILSEAEPIDYWNAVVGAYEKSGQTVEEALVNARLVRMLRAGEYNFDTEEIKLWSPDGA
jgi:DNA polymerase-1